GAGLADADALQMLLAAWDRLFALVKPDVVVADYAPAATLAARTRLPVILVGTGFTVPPAELYHFPLLHRAAPPAWRAGALVATVNAALRRSRLPVLDRLP